MLLETVLRASQAQANSLCCAVMCYAVKFGRLDFSTCLMQVPVSQHGKYWLDFGTNKYKPYALQGGATDLHMPFVAQVLQQPQRTCCLQCCMAQCEQPLNVVGVIKKGVGGGKTCCILECGTHLPCCAMLCPLSAREMERGLATKQLSIMPQCSAWAVGQKRCTCVAP